MANIEKLKKAVIEAHNAGDTQAAELFASKIKAIQLSQPANFSTKNMVKNIPGSALQYAKGITAPIHSYDTFFPAMKNLAQGAVQKLIPGEQPQEKYADAAGQFYVDRYGKVPYPETGIDNFGDYMNWRNKKSLQTLERDPVGAVSDASLLGSMASLPMMGTKAGKAFNKASVAIDPVNMAASAGKTAIKALTPKAKAAKLYESAAKFSTTIPKKKRDVMVQTALDEKLTPSGKGVAKLEDAIDNIDGRIENLISEATEKGGKISAKSVFGDLNDLRKELGSTTQADGIGNLKKISATAKKIGENQKRTGKEFYTVTELQKLKRNLYKDANFDVKQGKADPAINQTRKNIARKAKTLIEGKIPEVGKLNERYGKLIDLQPGLTRSANRIDNLNLMSINQPLNTGIGYGLGDAPGAIAASGLTALGHPKIKPSIAIYLNKLKQAGLLDLWMDNNYIPYATRQGLLQVERTSD